MWRELAFCINFRKGRNEEAYKMLSKQMVVGWDYAEDKEEDINGDG